MEQDKNKIQEPYPPENTPNPPQIIDPNVHEEPGQSKPAKKDDRDHATAPGKDTGSKKTEEKPKLLGESDTEIDDETTI